MILKIKKGRTGCMLRLLLIDFLMRCIGIEKDSENSRDLSHDDMEEISYFSGHLSGKAF